MAAYAESATRSCSRPSGRSGLSTWPATYVFPTHLDDLRDPQVAKSDFDNLCKVIERENCPYYVDPAEIDM